MCDNSVMASLDKMTLAELEDLAAKLKAENRARSAANAHREG